MIFEEVLLLQKMLRACILVARFVRLERTFGEDLLELELEGDVILPFLPVFLLVETGGVVQHEHLVARILHHEALGARVHRFEGIGR